MEDWQRFEKKWRNESAHDAFGRIIGRKPRPEEPEWRGGGLRSAVRTIVLTFADGELSDRPAATTVFDLAGSRAAGPQDALSDEVREFCRRRGIPRGAGRRTAR